jgi:hypothetical protein
LSRHDVQLLPLQQGSSSRMSVSDFQAGTSLHFQQQPNGQERGRSPEVSFEEMFPTNASAGGKLSKIKKAGAPKGWESWA